MVKILELFSGTGSVGNVSKSKGYEVVSLDILDKNKPTICTNILYWNYKHFSETFIPDFIWASPPCQTFSLAGHSRHRTKMNMTPKTKEGEIGLQILEKTVEIIKFFLTLNPSLKFAIENPRGLMRYVDILKQFDRTTGCYCLYGSNFMKPTDIWNNFGCELVMCKYKTKENYTFCHHDSMCNLIPTRGVNNAKLKDKYNIPAFFIEHILDQSLI
jgi:site-specific DNA-cytosine methylase